MKYDTFTLTTGQKLVSQFFQFDPDPDRLYTNERLCIEVNRALGVFWYYAKTDCPRQSNLPKIEKVSSDTLKRGKGGFFAGNAAIEIDVLETENWGCASKVIVRIPRNAKKTLRNLQPA